MHSLTTPAQRKQHTNRCGLTWPGASRWPVGILSLEASFVHAQERQRVSKQATTETEQEEPYI